MSDNKASKIEPGSEMHLTVLMAPHSLNLVVGEDRAHLLAFARDVWTASRSQALEEAAVIAEVKCDHFPPDQVAAAIRKLGAQE
jgi:hypothetical protein